MFLFSYNPHDWVAWFGATDCRWAMNRARIVTWQSHRLDVFSVCRATCHQLLPSPLTVRGGVFCEGFDVSCYVPKQLPGACESRLGE